MAALAKAGGRLVVVTICNEGPQGLVLNEFEWTHSQVLNLMNCRTIFVRCAIEIVGFSIDNVETMWVPVEVVRGVKPR